MTDVLEELMRKVSKRFAKELEEAIWTAVEENEKYVDVVHEGTTPRISVNSLKYPNYGAYCERYFVDEFHQVIAKDYIVVTPTHNSMTFDVDVRDGIKKVVDENDDYVFEFEIKNKEENLTLDLSDVNDYGIACTIIGGYEERTLNTGDGKIEVGKVIE